MIILPQYILTNAGFTFQWEINFEIYFVHVLNYKLRIYPSSSWMSRHSFGSSFLIPPVGHVTLLDQVLQCWSHHGFGWTPSEQVQDRPQSLYYSFLRVPIILGCESHRQAGLATRSLGGPIGHGFGALSSHYVKGTKYEVKQAQTAKCRDRTKTSWRYHHHQDHSVHYSFFLYKRHLSPRPSDLSQIARQKGAPQKLVGRNYFQAPQRNLVWETIGARV